MGHSIIHDQSERRREPGSLRLLHDYVVKLPIFFSFSLVAVVDRDVISFKKLMK